MNISCVIATHNRKTIYEAIESIVKQTHPAELIVIDDASVPPLYKEGVHIIRNSDPRGLSVCRNIGVEVAQGEAIAFMDDDAYAKDDWAEELVKSFQKGADIVGGLILPVWEWPRPWWLKDDMLHLISINTCSRFTYGCNFAVRKSLLEKLNCKFEERLGRKYNNLVVGDETELFFMAKEKGYIHTFNEKAIIHHIISKERTRFSYFLRRNFWEGRTEARRHRAKVHLFTYIRSLIQLAGGAIKHLDRERIEALFIQSSLFLAYIYGIFFESLMGAREYR